MDWTTKRVMITGAGGFVGSHLTERLVELGAKVKAFILYGSGIDQAMLDELPCRNDIEVVAGNITDYDSVAKECSNIDVIFHLASIISVPYSHQFPRETFEVNVFGALNILQAARETGCEKIVQTSTSEVYGITRYTPIDENHPLQGLSPYAASKISSDKLAESFFKSYNLPVAVCRPFNAYGPRQSTRAVIPTIITQALTQKTIKLGAAFPLKNFNYVKDTVNGFIKIAESDKTNGEAVNIGSAYEISINDLVHKINDLVGRNCEIEFEEKERMRPVSNEINRQIADYTKARSLAGWEPKYSLDEGLLETIEWYKNNLQRFDATRYTV